MEEELEEEGAPRLYSVFLINEYDPEVDVEERGGDDDDGVEGEGEVEEDWEERERNGFRIIRRRLCCVSLHRVFTPLRLMLLEGEDRGRCCEGDDLSCRRGVEG